MPDQGTMPINRRTASLAQGEELLDGDGDGGLAENAGDAGRERESRSVVVDERTDGDELGG